MEKEYLEMILEDISGKFDLVLEGHAALDRKFEARFDQLNEKIEDSNFKIDILNNKIDAVDVKLSKKIDDVAAELRSHRGYQVWKIKIGIMLPESKTFPSTRGFGRQ